MEIMNPWEKIDLNDYEKHMSYKGIQQMQTLNSMMQKQLSHDAYKIIMVLGVAGGNGLEHIKPEKINTVYGVDINSEYLKECAMRFPTLGKCLKTICCDISDDEIELPEAEELVADLFIEYVGYEHFKKAVQVVKPKLVSCIIQVNVDESFVSDSPFIHVFDHLDEVHYEIDGKQLEAHMKEIGYQLCEQEICELPNKKQLVRIDFIK